MIKFKKLLFEKKLREVGEGNIEAYNYKEVFEPSIKKAEYAFKTEEYQYLVDFDFENLDGLDGTSSHVYFFVTGEDPDYMTGENNTLRVINTVMKIIEEYVRNYLLDSGLSYLIFSGSYKDKEGSGLDNQRTKIYKRFLKKSFGYVDVEEKKLNGKKYLVIDLESVRK